MKTIPVQEGATSLDPVTVKINHVEILVQPYGDGRWGYDDKSRGGRRMIRCRTKEKAISRATDLAVLLANGRADLLQIDPVKLQRFLKWEAACEASPSIADAIKEFVALKSNKSTIHRRCLTGDLRLFEKFIRPTTLIGSVKALDIQRFLNSRDVGERRKLNLRTAIVGLFRWARRMSYLDSERTTEAEKVEPIEMVPGQVNVLSADQMRTLLHNVRDEYLPWLCIGAFAGIRSEEIAPERDSKKSPLMWEDFDWKHRIIIVRAETAKTKQEREVPILPNLAQWLAPWRNAKGAVIGDLRRPTKRETAVVGESIGGWKHNALRDSFCSYRTRITQNVAQTSYEMGNSISMVKRSYHRRQPIRAARQWFNIRPVKDAKTIQFRKSA